MTLGTLRDYFKGIYDATLSSSNMELYGATVASRPAANAVPVGATFVIVGTENGWQSNGTDWVVI